MNRDVTTKKRVGLMLCLMLTQPVIAEELGLNRQGNKRIKIETEFSEPKLSQRQQAEKESLYTMRHEKPHLWKRYRQQHGLDAQGNSMMQRPSFEKQMQNAEEDKLYQTLATEMTQSQRRQYYELRDMAEAGDTDAQALLQQIEQHFELDSIQLRRSIISR